jgi:hypothetical protein
MVGPTGSRLECRESSGHRIKPESNVEQITPKKWAVGPVQQLAWDRTGERSGFVHVPDRAWECLRSWRRRSRELFRHAA